VTRAWISVGSNVDRDANVRLALEKLGQRFGELVISPIYRTSAEGFEGDDFLNLVVGIDTELAPAELQRRLRRLEDEQGRIRGGEKFSSRTLDLDLLTWGQTVDPRLGLPRDEILRYAFVLRPLADVAPDERHPVDGRSYLALWRAFEPKPAMAPVRLPPYC